MSRQLTTGSKTRLESRRMRRRRRPFDEIIKFICIVVGGCVCRDPLGFRLREDLRNDFYVSIFELWNF